MPQSHALIAVPLAAVMLAAIPAIAAEPLTGKVVTVTDGDTVRVLDAAHLRIPPVRV